MAIYESKKPTKDGRKYFFRIKYKDVFGETHDYSSPKFKNRKEAVNEEALYRIKIANQKTYTSNVTIKQAFNEYLIEKSKRIKIQTVGKEKNFFKYFKSIEDLKINDLNWKIYRNWRNYIEKLDYTELFKNRLLQLFKRIIKYSSKYYNTSDSILKYVESIKNVNEIKKEMNFFTYKEYLKFDSAIDNFDYHVFFEILYFLGLRKGECQALTWKDINFNNKTLNINKTLTTKITGEMWTISSPKTQNSIRMLPITENLLNDLKTMYDNANKYRDFSKDWFVFGNTRPFAESTIEKYKNKYCAKAQLKKIRIHDFRHSCASLLINKGASISLVSKYLGHGNITITLNTYTHMYKSELENMTKILNNL